MENKAKNTIAATSLSLEDNENLSFFFSKVHYPAQPKPFPFLRKILKWMKIYP